MLVALEFVQFKCHIIVLTTTECLGVGIFEGHFLLFYLNPQSCHRQLRAIGLGYLYVYFDLT